MALTQAQLNMIPTADQLVDHLLKLPMDVDPKIELDDMRNTILCNLIFRNGRSNEDIDHVLSVIDQSKFKTVLVDLMTKHVNDSLELALDGAEILNVGFQYHNLPASVQLLLATTVLATCNAPFMFLGLPKLYDASLVDLFSLKPSNRRHAIVEYVYSALSKTDMISTECNAMTYSLINMNMLTHLNVRHLHRPKEDDLTIYIAGLRDHIIPYIDEQLLGIREITKMIDKSPIKITDIADEDLIERLFRREVGSLLKWDNKDFTEQYSRCFVDIVNKYELEDNSSFKHLLDHYVNKIKATVTIKHHAHENVILAKLASWYNITPIKDIPQDVVTVKTITDNLANNLTHHQITEIAKQHDTIASHAWLFIVDEPYERLSLDVKTVIELIESIVLFQPSLLTATLPLKWWFKDNHYIKQALLSDDFVIGMSDDEIRDLFRYRTNKNPHKLILLAKALSNNFSD